MTNPPAAPDFDPLDPARESDALAWLNALAERAVTHRLGMRFTAVDGGRLEATIPVEGNQQPYGLFHGGMHLLVAETVGSMSAAMLAGPAYQALGIEIGATHVRGTSAGHVHAKALINHRGSTLVNHTIELRDDAGKLLSTVRMTNLLRPVAGS